MRWITVNIGRISMRKIEKSSNNSSFQNLNPLMKNYWICAASEFKSTKMIAMIALLTALRIVIGAVFIPVTESLRVYFTFVVVALSSMIGGPIMALAQGFIADVIGYVIAPSGPYFFGYTFSAMLNGFIFALFLYKTKPTFTKVLASKTLVSVIVNIIIGSIWREMMFEKGYVIYVITSGTKNFSLLLIEVILLVLFLNAINPILVKSKLSPPKEHIIKITPWGVILTILVSIVGLILLYLYIRFSGIVEMPEMFVNIENAILGIFK